MRSFIRRLSIIPVSDEVFQQVIAVMTEYECENVAGTVATTPAIALEAALAQILADQLPE